MKIKKAVQIFALGIMSVGCIIFFIGCSKSTKTPEFSDGNYKDNMSDFMELIDYNTESSMMDIYFNDVSYTVEAIDNENKIAILNVSIPNFESILYESINECMSDNENLDYESLFELTKDKIEEKLKSSNHATISKQIKLEICKNDEGEWKMLPNDEFYGFISDSFLNVLEE